MSAAMDIRDWLDALERQGARFELEYSVHGFDAASVAFDGPDDVLNDEVLGVIQAQKPAVVAVLQERREAELRRLAALPPPGYGAEQWALRNTPITADELSALERERGAGWGYKREQPTPLRASDIAVVERGELLLPLRKRGR